MAVFFSSKEAGCESQPASFVDFFLARGPFFDVGVLVQGGAIFLFSNEGPLPYSAKAFSPGRLNRRFF